MEEDFWRQKAAIRWVTEGERNTKFFQGWVKQKRVRSRVHSIRVDQQVFTEEEDIRGSAVSFFENLLSSDIPELAEPDLNCLQSLPDSVDKIGLCATPSAEEVRAAVFDICGDSTSGPDGFSSVFFQSCWSTVADDVVAAVADFFAGSLMPRSFTATTIVLIPKKPAPETWADYRPISLCNVTNKIITKILTSRLAPLIPLVVAPNQSGFVQGRLLSDNVLLAQELIHDLQVRHRSPNVALKLDMAKAYDRVQWPFLLKVLERMGFPMQWLSLIERCVQHCWFSVLVNGTPAGFFPSSRGLRQGDPLSPSLFVLAADYLSRSLDRLILSRPDMIFHTRRTGFPISHLSYADDIIIFTKASRSATTRLMACLSEYASVSGQLVNVTKSSFFISDKFERQARIVAEVGGFQRGSLPFTYLGVPIYKGNQKAAHFLGLRQRLSDRIHSWSHRHLTFGGRLALIKSTLSTIPLHILQVIEPPGTVLQALEQIMARFFWGSIGEQRKTHWVSWAQICLPTDEGGLGLRRLSDLVVAFSYKLWWRFQARDSLWAQFLWAKYCLFSPPTCTVFSVHDSRVWRRLLHSGIAAHAFIRWSLGNGRVDFWEDIWLGDLPLARSRMTESRPAHPRVRDFWHDSAWHMDALSVLHTSCGLPAPLITTVSDTPILVGGEDVMRWSLSKHGEFSLTSAWEHVRQREPKRHLFGEIWHPCLVPNISIFLWRLLLGRVPVDVVIQSRRISLASMCLCCGSPRVESLSHLFVSSESAISIWTHFALWFPSASTHLHTSTDCARSLGRWRHLFPRASRSHISFLIPCLVTWFIWTERNSRKHRAVPFRASHVIWQVTHQLRTLVASGLLVPRDWQGCSPQVDFMPQTEQVRRPLRSLMVLWQPPEAPWVKLDTDGSFDVDTQAAAGGGLVRDHRGDLLAAFCTPLVAASSFEAELLALLHGLRLALDFADHIWIEMDASAVITLLSSGRRGSAAMRHTITAIRLLLRQAQVRFSHIHREGNRAADFMARRGAQTSGLIVYDRDSAPRYFLALVRMDQLGYPNFRFRR